MNGDELCELLGKARDDDEVKRALEPCVVIEIDEDGDGHAEAMDALGYQIDFGGNAVVCVQLIREYYKGALPKGLEWDEDPTLPELDRDDESVTVDAGTYKIRLVRDGDAVSALVAYPK